MMSNRGYGSYKIDTTKPHGWRDSPEKPKRAHEIQSQCGRDLHKVFIVADKECTKRTSTDILTRFQFRDRSALLVANAPFTMLDVVDLANATDMPEE